MPGLRRPTRRPPAALAALLAALLLPAAAHAQLSDLQPGPNYPIATVAFGGNEFTEDVDVGDVDNDGDLDVATANGGNASTPRPNRLFLNQGGAQGGTTGQFVDVSAVRLAGIPSDSSRDLEFADLEGDGDLDVLVANRGTTINGGEVSRAWINQGGLQAATVGFFAEGTDAFWGSLVSVPPGDELAPVDGQGPWRGFSCDCDFGDLDDDGALDLFYSTYGPTLTGGRDSRVFLNDGGGRFDELWPWVDAGADIQLFTLDVALADFDGDFDVDVFASSRESLPRLYRNNLGDGGAATLFTDVTATALPDLGAIGEDAFGYEVEFADLDQDGDFDAWMNNYVANLEAVLRNDGDLHFELVSWIRGDGGALEGEIDFLDYDGDGDLDVFATHVLGENWIYQGGRAQGLDADSEGLFHRTGTSALGSLAPWPETPAAGNDGYTLDGEVGDLDGDGDPDLLLANSFQWPNRMWVNALGVPDSHAPRVLALTEQADKSDGSDTVLHVRLADNAPFYALDAYDVRLVYTVDGGDPTCLRMVPQGGQQFRAVIPGGLDGAITYRVEATDAAGNTVVSDTRAYQQSSSGVSVWQNVGCGTPGVAGVPYLAGGGDLTGGSLLTVQLARAAPLAPVTLFLTVSSTPVGFKGGTLYTFPPLVTLPLTTDAGGQIVFQLVWPDGVSGFPIWWQYAIADATAQGGVSLSNALFSLSP